MLTFREQLEASYERSSGGSPTPTTASPSTPATPSNRGNSPGGMQGQRLVPSTADASPGAYYPDSGGSSPSTPNNQLSNGSSARPSLAQPRPGDMVLGGNNPAPRPGAGDMVLGGQGTPSNGGGASPNTLNGGNASSPTTSSTNPNYQPSGVSGGGSNNVLRGAANALNRFAKLPNLLQVPLELLAPDSANESEGEYLKKNAGKLKPDPYLNGEKPSPKMKGNGYPTLPQPKTLGGFKNGNTYEVWNIRVKYSYQVNGETFNVNFDAGNHFGKITSIFTTAKGNFTEIYAVIRNSPALNDFRTIFVAGVGFEDIKVGSPGVSIAPVGRPHTKDDEQQEDEPAKQPSLDSSPITNSDPTLQPANNPQQQGMPNSAKSPDAVPSIKPGQPVKPEGKDAPNIPGLPFIPLLPQLPTLPNAKPPGSPSPSPNNSPSPSPLNSPTSTPGQPSPVGGAVKAPQFSDKPGEFPQPDLKPKPQTFTPNKQPGEGDKCCPSQGEDLDAIKRILGVGEFPATLPLLSGGQTRIINNIPDLLLWNSSNVDSVAGYFPAKVTVVQGDSSEKSFELKNIGHAFEELFGALLLIAQDADASVNIGARTATEVIQTKIAVQQGNQLLTAIQKFLGFAVKPVAKVLKINFSPNADGIDNKLANAEMVNFLKPSTTTYVGSEIAEKKEALPIWERILNNTEIVRMAHWHPLKPDKAGKDNITGSRIAEKKGKPTAAEVKQWEAYLKILKDAGFIVDDNSPKKDSK